MSLASDRDAVVERLKGEYALGRLSDESLELRVTSALGAHGPSGLAGAVWDLPQPAPTHGLGGVWERALGWWTGEGEVTELHLGDVVLATDEARASWVVGRSRGCDARLTHPSVSRRHARVMVRGGRWSLWDLGSSNGTWLNGTRVRQATLRPGDDLVLGGLRAHVL